MVPAELLEFAEFFASLLRDHDFYRGELPTPTLNGRRFEFRLNGSCHLWLDLPDSSRAEFGRLIVCRYQDELRRYALELMERVGDISLPSDLNSMSRREVYSCYMDWIGMMLDLAARRSGDG